MSRPKEAAMNGLLAMQMFILGKIRAELWGRGWHAMQDGDEHFEKLYLDAVHGVEAVAVLLADARGDGDEQLALMALRDLAEFCASELRYTGVSDVYAALAMEPATV